MLHAPLTYAAHQLDRYILHAVAEDNEVTLSCPGGGPDQPVLPLTMTEANAMRALLHLPDVAAVLLGVEAMKQYRSKIRRRRYQALSTH